jgi:hypothetical protein
VFPIFCLLFSESVLGLHIMEVAIQTMRKLRKIMGLRLGEGGPMH